MRFEEINSTFSFDGIIKELSKLIWNKTILSSNFIWTVNDGKSPLQIGDVTYITDIIEIIFTKNKVNIKTNLYIRPFTEKHIDFTCDLDDNCFQTVAGGGWLPGSLMVTDANKIIEEIMLKIKKIGEE